ncbi:2'-5' RNA ligase superfamily protein [Halogranum rubrum]|uniref:2'-5' RNA ligase superfamily protein n=1 Tax=Halogranum rubrum TaxID=553466 RepID=A0A1I4HF39_9EURY|nr:2'-5' RNA ligase family protein [Halogranum rubrum]SFL40297.1 2'-5' RNA ligase superfamily protein [Halogranum rubrum]
MYSLNVPVPGGVRRLASELHPRLTAFDTVRDRHTLVAKRLGDDSLDRHRERLRLPLRDVSPFEARVTGIDFFERPTKGSAPVVYLVVESPGLFALHDRLCEEFGSIDGLEGDDYVPHVTLARGGTLEDAEALAALDIDPVTWTVSTLDLWNGKFRESAATLRLR